MSPRTSKRLRKGRIERFGLSLFQASRYNAGMKLHHAGALALVGWYLMVPPLGPDGWWDRSAPLPKYKVMDSFDTAKECRDNWVKYALAFKQVAQNNPDKPQSQAIYVQYLHAQCV